MEIRNWRTNELIYKDKSKTFKKCFENAVKKKINLSYANMQNADMRDADMRDANMQGADMRDANMQNAYMRDANMQGADMRGANMRDANMQNAYMRGANMRDANMQNAYMRGANMQYADMQGAYMQGADIDMSGIPLSCGGLKWKIDRRLFVQFVYHLCSHKIDDGECKDIQKSLIRLANEFHRTDVPRLEVK